MHNRLLQLWNSFSATGLIVGTLFMAASLTPSLLPRTYVMQGLLSGISLACGYGLGVLLLALWRYLELPHFGTRLRFSLKTTGILICLPILVLFFWRAAEWQNSIRSLMNMPPVETMHPFYLGLIAIATFTIILLISRFIYWSFKLSSRQAERVAPPKIAYIIGGALVLFVFWSAAEGLLFRVALHTVDSSLRALDELIEPDIAQPTSPEKTGSPASLISWPNLGRAGRDYITSGPTAEEISAFRNRPAKEPVRVYVGLNAAQTPEARAKLALKELIRTGGFERSSLVLIAPTGTGWVDEEGIDPLEYMLDGDVASVAVQYSYLLSWLSLLVEPDYGSVSARALFREVYAYWTELPKETRPKLYLYGLSLGALSSEVAAELFEIIGDPYDGALFAGPPFPGRVWQMMTESRNEGSPAWLPRVGNGSYVRFTSQHNALNDGMAEWGPIRTVYLQYASDPIVFFEYSSLYSKPEWMDDPRGPDVSEEFHWYPVITFLQLVLDLATATTTPKGYGHVYAGEHYIDAWQQIVGLEGWSEEDINRLKNKFRANR